MLLQTYESIIVRSGHTNGGLAKRLCKLAIFLTREDIDILSSSSIVPAGVLAMNDQIHKVSHPVGLDCAEL